MYKLSYYPPPPPPLPPFYPGVIVVFALIVVDLLEEPEKLICDIMTNTVHSIDFQYFLNKWPELLPVLLGQIPFNVNLCQAL